MSVISYNKRKGNYGEDVAEGYLTAKGYAIIGRNYKRGAGEIDIIAKDGEYIVFVEVKYRKNLSAGLPREAVTKTKRRALTSAAKYYIMENEIDDGVDMRFDVVEIVGAEQLSIEHIINAF